MKSPVSDRIVVPYDFSEASLESLKMALFLRPEGGDDDTAAIHVLHVMIDWYPTDPSVVLSHYNEEEFKEATYHAMEKKLQEAGIDMDRIQLNVSIGDPGSQIVDLAEEVDASLIVIPSHGRRGLKRVLLGSVAERVVRLAKCPVLVLK